MSNTARIPSGDKYVCCARLSEHNAMYCRRRATTFVLYDDPSTARLWRRDGAPYCDQHLRTTLAEMKAQS